MAKNVFISFRFSDGQVLKEELCQLFDQSEDVVNYSEDEDRSKMSEVTIKEYLYAKLKQTSVTIVLLTPNAISYNRNSWTGKYDDWLYDELRYSLEDRESNRTNGAVALYTKDARDMLVEMSTHQCEICGKKSDVLVIKEFDNLVKKNMMNVKMKYKKNECNDIYDSMEDSYISLIRYEDFVGNIDKYIENATSKRNRKNEFEIVKWL